MAIVMSVHLNFKMTESFFVDAEQSQEYLYDFNNKQTDAFLSSQAGEMMVPHITSNISAPIAHFTSARRIQKASGNSLIIKRLLSYIKIIRFKNPSQLLCCFVSGNDLFVVILRHLII